MKPKPFSHLKTALAERERQRNNHSSHLAALSMRKKTKSIRARSVLPRIRILRGSDIALGPGKVELLGLNRADRLHQPGGPADGHVLYARVVARPDDEPVLQATARSRRAWWRRRRRRETDRNRRPGRGPLSADGTGKLARDRCLRETTAPAAADLTNQGKDSPRLRIRAISNQRYI